MAEIFKKLIAAAAVALALASCSRDSILSTDLPLEGPQPYIFNLGDPGTKALLGADEVGRFGQWESGDRMGTIVVSNSGGVTLGYSTVTPGSPATVAVYNGYKKFSGGETVRAYYPYNENTKSVNEVVLSIPVDQVQSGKSFDFDAMPMVSGLNIIPEALDNYTYPVNDLLMANLASLAEFRIYSSNSEYAGEKVVSVRFDANSALAGPFTKDISAVDLTDDSTLAISGYSETSATTSVSQAPDFGSSLEDAFSVYVAVAPGTYGGSVTITTDRAVYRFPLKSSQTFRRSVIRVLGVDLGSCQDITEVSSAGAVTVSTTIEEILISMGKSGVANGTVVNPLTVDDVITLSTTGTGNNGKVYGSATEWRIYTSGGGNVVISAADGYELRSVSLAHGKTNASANDYSFGGPASGVSQSVSGRSVTFNMLTGNMRITGISVTYVPVDAVPEVVTGSVQSLAATSVKLTASYNNIDTAHLPQDKGFYWGTSETALDAEAYDDDTLVESTRGSFSTTLYGLTPETTYYYQAFMTVWTGSEYETITGEVMTFTTPASYDSNTRGYLDCYEIPQVSVTKAVTGTEPIGGTSWYQFDLSVSTQKLVTHTYPYGGKIYRNYTSCVDQTKRCPLWVAYPMHAGAYPNLDAGRGSWSDAGYDPAIPASWQSSGSTSDYNNGEGYARGHLCASEDRQTNEYANYQTFYYTNQAPQRQNSFNSGVWSDLESAVQKAAPTGRDTLYVVSGTLFEDDNTGSSNDGGTVARPSHFYKLLMLCSFDASGNMTAACGAAYLYENKQHTGTTYGNSTYRRTIDQVEELAGFDFFANVPATLQDQAESAFTNLL